MADSEVATKAPESDAQEDQQAEDKSHEKTTTQQDAQAISGIPGDSKPDQGAASMGEHCVTDRPTPAGSQPTGEITKYDEIEVYITKPADYPHQPCKLLLLLTGGTGIHSTNNQIQADKYAAEGFLVVMPDQFGGDAAPTTTTTSHAEEDPSLLEKVKLEFANVAKSFTIDMWLARHTPEKVLPVLHRVIASVKEEFADAASNGGGIYAVGYCFGAKYVLLLGGDASQVGTEGEQSTEAKAEQGLAKPQGPQIKAGAIAHGTQIGKEDMEKVAVPVCVVAVQDDPLFPDEVREEGIKAIVAKGIEHEVKVYPGVPHGFAVWGDYENEKIVQAQKDAFAQMLEWLKAH